MRIRLRGLRCWQWYWSRIVSYGIRRHVDWYIVISVVEELVVSVVRVVSERIDSEFLRNADNYSPTDMASYPRRRESSKIYSSYIYVYIYIYIYVCVCVCCLSPIAHRSYCFRTYGRKGMHRTDCYICWLDVTANVGITKHGIIHLCANF